MPEIRKKERLLRGITIYLWLMSLLAEPRCLSRWCNHQRRYKKNPGQQSRLQHSPNQGSAFAVYQHPSRIASLSEHLKTHERGG